MYTDGQSDGQTARETYGTQDETSIPLQLRLSGRFNKAPISSHGIPTITRTTRTPAFWDTPKSHHPTPWLSILVIHIRSQVKRRQSQGIFFNLPKIQILIFCKVIYIRQTCLIRSINMIDPPRTEGVTEQTRVWDWRTDGQTDGVKQIYPSTTSLWGGIIR